MSEKQLGVVFAFTVLILVILGRSESILGEDPSLKKTEFATASLVAQSEPAITPVGNQKVRVKEPKDVSIPQKSASPTSSPKQVDEAVEKAAKEPRINYPILNAAAFLVADLERKDNISEFKANQRWPIASITKLMTALVALQNIPSEEKITITDYALSTEGPAGDFKLGEIFTLLDLVKALIVSSSNDAAAAIQDFYGRGKFISIMNERARALNMLNTNFNEPSGLSAINQSTANDLKILVNYIYENQRNILDISTEKEISILDLNSNSSRILRNINLFAGDPDFLGGKTGFINESGGNLVAVFLRSRRPIITVVLGAGDRFEETKKLMRWLDDTL
ncbi:MAG: D-alanyl-D-alanine carboxypeptidase [Candidatus Liptonbacteria bacterium]|nr:D-alanyl-D-alanine carboxypeptidase [Candidatus Liptonbacteria bacterium]